MTKFGIFLDEFMKKNRYTLEYIALQTSSSLAIVGHYRKGIRIPKDDFIEKFIDSFINDTKLQNSLRYMVAYDRSPELIKQKLDSLSSVDDCERPKPKLVPFLGKAAAGNGYINFDDSPKYESIYNSTLPSNAYIVEVAGDSMYPTLNDGDLVAVNPSITELSSLNGKICIFNYHDQTFIKRLKLSDGLAVLVSDNSDKDLYKDIVIPQDEFEFLKCHGSIIESKRKY